MNWLKAIGFGILIWVLMFAIVSAIIAFNLYGSLWMSIVIAVIAGIIALIMAGFAKPSSACLAIAYGLSWVVIGLILDYFVTTKFNANILREWSVWLGYALILFAPLLRIKKQEVI